jgi:Domain of unknown function (DUF4395)
VGNTAWRYPQETGVDRIFQFGDKIPAYDIRVLNEREARAGAGILLVIALVAFMNAWLDGNFNLIQMVVIGFFVDFFIRVLINPRFAPSLVLGRIMVRNQVPEYTGAAQKRFAWALGFLLASITLYVVMFQGMRGPGTLLICLVCLILLFFETAFGICLGCKIYNGVSKNPAQLCPGGVCEIRQKAEIQKISLAQLAALGSFIVAISVVTTQMPAAPVTNHASPLAAPATMSDAERERCKVPEFAKKIGHEEKWKRHNNCL